METKEYYQSLIAVIRYVSNGNTEITYEKGVELAGNYWPRICRLLKAERTGVSISGGEFHVTRGVYLNPIYEDCKHSLEELERQEADRELDRASKYAGIKYSKKAYHLSIVSLIVAACALLWQVIVQILTA